MITKAIVEHVIDPYNIRVRIPSIDGMAQSNVHVRSEDLDVAVVSTLPGCHMNLRAGDIVLVSSDTAEEDPIIIGCLYRKNQDKTFCEFDLYKLSVEDKAVLPKDTSIGSVTKTELSYLKGLSSPVQKQLSDLSSKIQRILEVLSSLNSSNKELTQITEDLINELTAESTKEEQLEEPKQPR